MHILFLSCLLPSWLWAVNAREDSLLAVIKTLPEDTSKVLTYNELYKATMNSEPLKALGYGQKALALARELKYQHGIARMCNNLGVWHSKRGNYEEALRYYAQARITLAQLNDSIGRADCEMNIGSVQYKRGKFGLALKQYRIAFVSYSQLRDTTSMLTAVNNMGSVYKEQGHYSEALQAYMAALDLRERLKTPVELGQTCANVGSIHQLQGNLSLAKEFFMRALALAVEGKDEFGRITALTSIAEVEMEQQNLTHAAQLLQEARETAAEIDDQYGLAAALLAIAHLHQMQGAPDSAIACYAQALSINRTIGRDQGTATTLHLLGALQLDQGKSLEAEANLKESLALSDSIATLELSRDNHALLAKLFAGRQMYDQAYFHQGQYLLLHDSLYTAASANQIAEMQARYQTRQQQDEIGRLVLQATQDQLRISKSSSRTLVLVAVVIVLLLIGAIIFLQSLLRRRHKRRVAEKNREIHAQRDLLEAQNRQIREINVSLERIVEQRTLAMRNANSELDTFLYESAHALRRPLLRIQGLEDIIATEEDPMALIRLRGQMRVTLAGMDELLHKLIFVSESGHRDIKLQPVLLHALVTEIAGKQAMAEVLRCEIASDFSWMTDGYLINALLTMILENAFRFLELGRKGQCVTVSVEGTEQTIKICVADTGNGIAPEHVAKVCEMFFRGPNHRGGNGLGLYIASKIVAKLQGTLDFRSEVGKGTAVTVELPRNGLMD